MQGKKEKISHFLKKKHQFSKLKEKNVALRLLEFQEQFMISNTFLRNWIKSQKTGAKDKYIIPLGNLFNKISFQNQKLIMFLVTFTLLLFDSGVCLPFKTNKNKEFCELKRNTKLNTRKSFRKYHLDLYKSIYYVHDS